MVPMPRRKIQSAFLSWLEDNRDRFALEIRLGRRTDEVQEFFLAGINPAITGTLATYEIEVYAMHEDDCWDILLSAWGSRNAPAAAAFSARLAGPTPAARSPTAPRCGPTICSTRCSNG
jgi:hypothetical protein